MFYLSAKSVLVSTQLKTFKCSKFKPTLTRIAFPEVSFGDEHSLQPQIPRVVSDPMDGGETGVSKL